jgi:nucleoside-diphosphate-sugar epimerase
LGEIIFLNFSRKSRFSTAVLRIHNAYGPRMGWEHVIPEFCRRLVLGEKFTIEGEGSETRSFCYVDDVVDGMLLSARDGFAENEVFNLGNDEEETTILNLAYALARIAKQEIKPVFKDLKKGSVERRYPDISKARRILGYRPKVSLNDGLRRTYRWYEKEIGWWIKNSPKSEYPWLRTTR